jgi:hypothetical protein
VRATFERAFLFDDELAFHAIVPKTTKLCAFEVIRSWHLSDEIKDLIGAFGNFSIFLWVVEQQSRKKLVFGSLRVNV